MQRSAIRDITVAILHCAALHAGCEGSAVRGRGVTPPRYSQRFHLKNRYGSTAAITISTSANG
jgi:hypothetical protein